MPKNKKNPKNDTKYKYPKEHKKSSEKKQPKKTKYKKKNWNDYLKESGFKENINIKYDKKN